MQHQRFIVGTGCTLYLSRHVILRLDDEVLRIAVGIRLGSNLCDPHECTCGSLVDYRLGVHIAYPADATLVDRHDTVSSTTSPFVVLAFLLSRKRHAYYALTETS